jgi:hypothetical protein
MSNDPDESSMKSSMNEGRTQQDPSIAKQRKPGDEADLRNTGEGASSAMAQVIRQERERPVPGTLQDAPTAAD